MVDLKGTSRRWLWFLLLSIMSMPAWATPDTVIESPKDIGSPNVFGIGEQIVLRASATNLSDSNYEPNYDWQLIDLSTDTLIQHYAGQAFTITIDTPGRYLLTCVVSETSDRDPTPATREIIVADRDAISPVIVIPEEPVIRAGVGQAVRFQAEIARPKMPDPVFVWEVSALKIGSEAFTLTGASVDIRFPAPGRYLVRCAITDPDSGHVSPNLPSREVIVQQANLEIIDPKPDDHGLVHVEQGQTLQFTGVIQDLSEQLASFYWEVQPEGAILCEGQLTCNIPFPDPGPRTVKFIAVDAMGQEIGSHQMRIRVAGELDLRILEPGSRGEFPIGAPITLKAEALGKLAADAEIFWVFRGQVFEGKEVHLAGGFDTQGHYQIEVVARTKDQEHVVRRALRLLIHDPANPPVPQIISPRTDLRLPVGTMVFCDSSWRRTPNASRHLLWQIVQLGENGRIRIESFNPTLGRYMLNMAATYECRLYLRTDEGNVLVDQRTFVVEDTNPEDFDNNNSLANAASISPGTYQGLNLDREQYFSFLLGDRGLDVVIRPEFDGDVIVRFYGSGTTLLLERQVRGGTPLQIPAFEGSIFKIGFLPVPGSTVTPNKKLDFSFSVDVLNPGLYFPDIVDNGVFSTRIGMVNPNGETAETEILAYSSSGDILEKIAIDVPANGQFRALVDSIFPDLSGQIAWLRVDTTRNLAGFSHVESNDGMEAFAVGGVRTLQKELFVPHIASDTNTWYTRASVVNGLDDESDSLLTVGDDERELTAKTAYTKDGFDFEERLGLITEDIEWGVFSERNNTASLAGVEVFGKADGTRQIVGLSLAPAPRDNANFTATVDTLYFTHVARDTANFWTGFTLVNIAEAAQGAIVRAYGPGGSYLGEKTIQLQSGEKIVELADTFLQDFGGSSEVDWVEVVSDGGVVGYELFGTRNTKQMAGLEAIDEVRNELCFPFVDNTGQRWHGFALVNVSGNAANVDLDLVDAEGNVLDTQTVQLSAKEKSIFVLRDLFGDIPVNASWVRAASDQLIAGFQLVGTEETMSGLIAQ